MVLEIKQLLGQGISGPLVLPGHRQALGAAPSRRLQPLRRIPSATVACELNHEQLRPPLAKPRVWAGVPRAPLQSYPSSLAPNPLVTGVSSGEAPPLSDIARPLSLLTRGTHLSVSPLAPEAVQVEAYFGFTPSMSPPGILFNSNIIQTFD